MQSRRARHPERPIDDALPLRDTNRSPEQRAIDSESSEHIWAKIRDLPEEQRIALVLRFYLEYTTPEIAQSTGWPQGTVKSRLSRGVAGLRLTVDASLAGDIAEEGAQA